MFTSLVKLSFFGATLWVIQSCGILIKDKCSGTGSIESEGSRVFRCSAENKFDAKQKVYLPGLCTKSGFSFHTDGFYYSCINDQGDIYFEDDQIDLNRSHVVCFHAKRWINIEKKNAQRNIWIYCDAKTPSAIESSWEIQSGIEKKSVVLKDFLSVEVSQNYRDDKITVCSNGLYKSAQDRSEVVCEP